MNDQRSAWSFLKVALFHAPTEARLTELSGLAMGSAERWRRIVALANAHFVTPALWLAVRDAIEPLGTPEPVREYLESIHGVNRARNKELLGQLDELIHALNRRSIAPTLLKGAAYLKTGTHGDIGARFLSDLDVLVEPEQLAETKRVLAALGYVPGRPGEVDDENHHHVRPMYREGESGVVEIHREAVGACASEILPGREAMEDGQEHREGGIHYRSLSPSHLVTASFLHAEVADRHLRSFILGLRPMQDVSALHATYGSLIDWPGIEARLTRYGLGNLFRKYLLATWRITGIRPLPRTRFRVGDLAHYRLSETRMQRPGVGRWLARLARLSAHEVQRRYGETDGWAALTRHRLRRAGEMTRSWLYGRAERRGI